MTTPPNIMVQLIHIHGGLKGEIQEFYDSPITVGRLSNCSVRFAPDEPGVSREHASIQREGNQFKLTDVSKYGTSVNGRAVKDAWLRSGDVLEFGPGGPKVSFTMEVVASLPPGVQVSAPARPAGAPSSDAFGSKPRPLQPSPASPGALQPQQPPQPPQPAPPPVHPPYQATGAPREAYLPQGPYPVQKTLTPLVIQFGPTIRSFRELPVTLGGGSQADFVIRHQSIQELHAQIFFHQNRYCVRDLTGQGLLTVNQRRVEDQAQLNLNDEISCGPRGPVFRFLGEGRLAEVEQVPEPAAPDCAAGEQKVPDTLTRNEDNFFAKLVKGFKP